MEPLPETCQEGVFDIVWHQHDPDDWMAEIVDARSGERALIYSVEDLTRFVQGHLKSLFPQSTDR